MNVEQYDSFFRDYYKYICHMVGRAGIRTQDIQDVSSDIILKIVEQDGLGKFDPDKNVKIRTYITSYVMILSKAQAIRNAKYYDINRTTSALGLVDHDFTDSYINLSNAFPDSDLYERLKESVDGDALVFLDFAADSKDYRLARKNLSDMGWEKRRITAAVKTVRKQAMALVDA